MSTVELLIIDLAAMDLSTAISIIAIVIAICSMIISAIGSRR